MNPVLLVCRRCGTARRRMKNGKTYCPRCQTESVDRYIAANVEKVRESKRLHTAKRRSDPTTRDAINAARRTPDAHAREKRSRDRIRDRHFFRHRARLWSGRWKVRVSASELAGLWMRQRGCCALTGVKLDRTAELDHRHPQSRGGCDTIENLQWVTGAANSAKRDLTTAEFVELCRSVVALHDRLVP